MRAQIIAVLGAASLGWGLAGVGVRAVYQEGGSTFTVVVVRTTIATLAVVLFGVATRRRPTAAAWLHGSLIGILRIGLAPIVFIASLNYISAGVESLVITLIPVVTAAMGAAFLRETLQRTQVAGLALGIAGTTLLIASGDSGIADGSGNTVIGGGLALAGVLFGSASGILSRRFAPLHDTTTLSIPMFISGAIVALLGGALARDIEMGDLNSRAWQLLVLLALGSTLLPFVATLYASRHTTAANVALTAYIAPVIGVIGGAVLLGEVITPAILLGGLLTLTGVVMVGHKATAPR
ncbi:MAG: DMT family transporter [Acidimicrobiia bacterium]|nr:DMT family transporter [Acidimicrobiia bacterium]